MTSENHLLYVEIIQSESIKNLFETLREIIVDCNMVCDNAGIHIRSMDPGQTTIVSLVLFAEDFNVYHCVKDRKLTLGININSIHKIFKRLKKDDVLTLEVHNNEDHELLIRIDNSSKKQSSRINYKLLDLTEEDCELPSVNFQSIIRMPSNSFQQLCRDIKDLGTKLEIRSSGDNIIFCCKGDFASDETVLGTVDDGEDGLVIVNKAQGEVVRGVYSLKSLLQFTKAASLHSSVEIFLMNDFPMIIKYPVADLGELKFVLAPLSDE